MIRFLAALLAAAPCAGAQAQTAQSMPVGAPLSLQSALELAGVSAPSLEAASANVRAAEAARSAAGARPNPTVMVEAENVVGTGPYAGTDSMEATASLALPVELGGKRAARVAIAGAQRDRALIERAIAEIDLRFSVMRAYREGKFGQLDLLDAERTLAETRASAIEALLSYHIAQAQLERLQEAFGANTAIKFAGGVSAKDARSLGSMLYCDPGFIEAQPKGHFAAHVRGVTKAALPLAFPFGWLEERPKMTEAQRSALRQRMRNRYAVHYSQLGRDDETETAPEADDPGSPSPLGHTDTEAGEAW